MTRLTRKTLDQLWSRVAQQINREANMTNDKANDLEDVLYKLVDQITGIRAEIKMLRLGFNIRTEQELREHQQKK